MDKIKTIAFVEFSNFLQTKAILVMLILFPILMAGPIALQQLTEGQTNMDDRRFAVIDHSEKIYPILEAAALQRNELIKSTEEGGALFVPENVSFTGKDLDEIRLELSERIQNEELFAFIEIPEEVLEGKGQFQYHSLRSTDRSLMQWLNVSLNMQLRLLRYQEANLTPDTIQALESRVRPSALGIFERGADGTIVAAKEVDMIKTVAAPAILIGLLFIIIMVSAPQQLNAVLEEKINRVSEVLLGSTTPFELMMGKLIGSVMISLLIAGLYLGGGLAVLTYLDKLSYIPLHLLPYFFLFMVIGVFLFGSISLAIGSACSDFKDAQSMATPLFLFIALPMMVLSPIIQNPDGPIAVGLSLFPTATPFVMLFRMSIYPYPPVWQLVLAIALTTLTTLAAVWAAGRIFRVGVLLQGKSAGFGQMIRWIFRKDAA